MHAYMRNTCSTHTSREGASNDVKVLTADLCWSDVQGLLGRTIALLWFISKLGVLHIKAYSGKFCKVQPFAFFESKYQHMKI